MRCRAGGYFQSGTCSSSSFISSREAVAGSVVDPSAATSESAKLSTSGLLAAMVSSLPTAPGLDSTADAARPAASGQS